MSFFSKIIQKEGEKQVENVLKGVLNGVFTNRRNHTTEPAVSSRPEQSFPSPYSSRPAAAPAPAPSGDSWGETMPAEENQFSFPGRYHEYFMKVFSEDFPAYRLEREIGTNEYYTVITFWQGDSKALVVELKSETSSSNRLRKDCQAAGIPYLRFYYNHDHWWNTRSYVVGRTRAALGL